MSALRTEHAAHKVLCDRYDALVEAIKRYAAGDVAVRRNIAEKVVENLRADLDVRDCDVREAEALAIIQAYARGES